MLCKRGPIVVFIADLNRSRSAEKECHLSLLEQRKIDQAKNDQSFTSFEYKNPNKILKTFKAKFQAGQWFRLLLYVQRLKLYNPDFWMVFLDFWYINNIVRITFSVGVFYFRTQLYEFPNTWASGVRSATPFFSDVQKSCSSFDFVKRVAEISFFPSHCKNY